MLWEAGGGTKAARLDLNRVINSSSSKVPRPYLLERLLDRFRCHLILSVALPCCRCWPCSGWDRHPHVRQFLQAADKATRRKTTAWHAVVVPLVYHCDLESQYQDMAVCQAGNLSALLADRRQRKHVAEAAIQLSEDSLFMRYALEHLRASLAPGAILLIPSAIFHVAASPLPTPDGREPLPISEVNGRIFMQTLIMHPSGLKTVPGQDEVKPPADSMIVTTLQQLPAQHDDDSVLLGVQKPPPLYLYNCAHRCNTREIWQNVAVFAVKESRLSWPGTFR